MRTHTEDAALLAGPQVGARRAWLMAHRSTLSLLLCISVFVGLLAANVFKVRRISVFAFVVKMRMSVFVGLLAAMVLKVGGVPLCRRQAQGPPQA